MTLQQMTNQAGVLSQHDFLNYIYQLKKIAKEKYSFDIFLQDFGKEGKNVNAEIYNSLVLEKINKEEAKKKPVFGIFKGRLKTPDNFNEPLEDFKDYM